MQFLYRYFFLIYLLSIGDFIFAQDGTTEYPEVGKLCPKFSMKNVQYHVSQTVSLNSQKGRHFILDFFSSGCVSCVQAFPKTNKLYAQFKNKVDIILVGKEDKKIRSMFERFRKSQHLSLPVVYDSVLPKKFGIEAYPTLIWVNDRGIVKAVTTAADLTEENLNLFLSEKEFLYQDVSTKSRKAKENAMEFSLLLSIQDKETIYSASLLTSWNKNSYTGYYKEFIDIPFFESRGGSLHDFYNLAYWGATHFWPGDSLYGRVALAPSLEMADPSFFTVDFDIPQGIYNYYQFVPPSMGDTKYRMQLLQEDLKRAFGYFVDSTIKKLPAMKLVVIDSIRTSFLKSAGGKFSINTEIGHADYKARNISIDYLLRLISSYHNSDNALYIDGTGINYQIDIDLNCVMTDFNDILKSLRENGLDFIEDEVEVKVLVIKDPSKK